MLDFRDIFRDKYGQNSNYEYRISIPHLHRSVRNSAGKLNFRPAP